GGGEFGGAFLEFGIERADVFLGLLAAVEIVANGEAGGGGNQDANQSGDTDDGNGFAIFALGLEGTFGKELSLRLLELAGAVADFVHDVSALAGGHAL